MLYLFLKPVQTGLQAVRSRLMYAGLHASATQVLVKQHPQPLVALPLVLRKAMQDQSVSDTAVCVAREVGVVVSAVPPILADAQPNLADAYEAFVQVVIPPFIAIHNHTQVLRIGLQDPDQVCFFMCRCPSSPTNSDLA